MYLDVKRGFLVFLLRFCLVFCFFFIFWMVTYLKIINHVPWVQLLFWHASLCLSLSLSALMSPTSRTLLQKRQFYHSHRAQVIYNSPHLMLAFCFICFFSSLFLYLLHYETNGYWFLYSSNCFLLTLASISLVLDIYLNQKQFLDDWSLSVSVIFLFLGTVWVA